MGSPTACGGTLTITELHQDHRRLQTAVRYVPVGQTALFALAIDSVEQSYRHLYDQLAQCCDNAPPSPPLGTTLTGHTDAGGPLCFVVGISASGCWTLLSSYSRFCRPRRRSDPLVRRI
jgi:hypothetical protein